MMNLFSKHKQLNELNPIIIFSIILIFIIPLLFYPVYIPEKISILANIAQNIVNSGNIFNFSYYNDVSGFNEIVIEGPLLILFLSILNFILGSSFIPIYIISILYLIISFYFLYMLLIDLKNYENNQVLASLLFMFIFTISVIIKGLYYDLITVLIVINIPFIYLFYKGTIIIARENEISPNNVKFLNYSFLVLVISILFFGFISIFSLILAFQLLLVLRFHFSSEKKLKKLFSIESKLILLHGSNFLLIYCLYAIHLYLVHLNFIIFIIIAIIYYVITILVSDNLIKNKLTNYGDNKLLKYRILAIKNIQNFYIIILLCFLFVFIWMEFLANSDNLLLPYDSILINNLSSIENLMTNLYRESIYFIFFVLIMSFAGLLVLIKDKSYKPLLFLLIFLSNAIFTVLIPISLLFNSILILFLPLMYLFFNGIHKLFILKIKFFEFQDSFEKIALSIPMLIFILALLIYQDFKQLFQKEYYLLNDILINFILIVIVYIVLLKLDSSSLFISIIFLLSAYMIILDLPKTLVTNLSINNILIIGITFYFFFELNNRDKSKIPAPILIFLVINVGVLPISNQEATPSITLEEAISIIKSSQNGHNKTYWIEPDQELRLAVMYLLTGTVPSNDQNYGYYPLSLNSSANIDGSSNIPKYFMVNKNNLIDQKFFGSIDWLQDNFQERFLDLGKFRSQNTFYFYY